MRWHSGPWLALILALAPCCWLAGCRTETETATTGQSDHADHDDEPADKDEHAGHVHGPNGGPVAMLGDSLQVEWIRDKKTDTVTVIVWDKELKAESPIAASEVTMHIESAGRSEDYKLAAEQPAADGKASRFALKEWKLSAALSEADQTKATLKVTLDGKEHAVPLEIHGH
jgi:hypothetical protein